MSAATDRLEASDPTPAEASDNEAQKVAEKARRVSITASLAYFTQFKLAVWKAKANHQQLPVFKALVPKMKDGVAAVFGAYDTVLSTPKMAKSLARCFQKVGLAATPSEEHSAYFVQYQLASRHGVATTASAIIREPTDLEGISLASSLCPMESRGGAESDHDTEEGEESESESDGDISDDRDMDRSFAAAELAELGSMQDE